MSKSESLVHLLTVVDGVSEELLSFEELKTFVLKDFQEQFDVDPVLDPDMRDRYSVGPDDVAFLERNMKKSLSFDFQKYAYFIEAAKKG